MNKDWTGNSKTAFVTLGASNHSAGERQAHDFYATSPMAVSQLLDAEVFSRDILEPCCGAGHIAKVLAASGYNVKAQDLYDYGYGESGVDFLAYNKPFNGDIITNPPYKYATEFVVHALELIPPPAAWLCSCACNFSKAQSDTRAYSRTEDWSASTFRQGGRIVP